GPHRHLLGVECRKHPVQVPELEEQVLKMSDPVPAEPSDMRDLPPQLPTGAVETDLLVLAELHRVVVVKLREFLIEQAHPAGIDCPRLDLERTQELLELLVPLHEPDIRLAKVRDEVLGRRMPVLLLRPPLHPVPGRPGATGRVRELDKPGAPDIPAIVIEQLVDAPPLGLDNDLHGAIRSWITYASSTLSSRFKKSVNSSSTITIAQSIPWNAASITPSRAPKNMS